jgi:hypothetical protein
VPYATSAPNHEGGVGAGQVLLHRTVHRLSDKVTMRRRIGPQARSYVSAARELRPVVGLFEGFKHLMRRGASSGSQPESRGPTSPSIQVVAG